MLRIAKVKFMQFFHLDRTGNVETLLHARDVELDHPQVFAFDDDPSLRPQKSEGKVV